MILKHGVCFYYRKLNTILPYPQFPNTAIDEILDIVMCTSFMSNIDLTSEYFPALMKDRGY